ncbi:MAG: PadR family transcriptional regulator [Candidatus Bathyarchaeia archaeon]
MFPETETIAELYERLVNSFMDIIVLARLRKSNDPMSGYDVIKFIHKKFHTLVSSGTVYALLYSMERDGLIKGRRLSRKRVYTITEKGEKMIESILKSKEEIQLFVRELIGKQATKLYSLQAQVSP